MNNTLAARLLGAALASLLASSAWADASTPGLDPYAAGAGFSLPQDATWGGWTRGSAGTAYAEWDFLSDAEEDFWSGTVGDPQGVYGDKKAGADVGSHGVRTGTQLYTDFGANTNTYISGMGNIFSGLDEHTSAVTVHVEPTELASGPVRVAFQFELMGTVHANLNQYLVALNGQAPSFAAVTGSTDFTHPQMGVTMPVERYVFYWDLATSPTAYDLGLTIAGSTSLTQYAVDIAAAPVPEPQTWALLLAGLALVGSITQRRKA